MSTNSTIEWTECTWNPITGCKKVSTGCKNCYAERMAKRLKAMGNANYVNGFQLALHNHSLQIPFRWKKPRHIFVNSMSDLFHEDVPLDFIKKVFEVIKQANWHTYQILTKRSECLLQLDSTLHWANNTWMGVSIENSDYTYRLDHLRLTNAALKFISFEPLLGPISKLNLKGINWVIVGCESGPRARPTQIEWVRLVRDQCHKAKVPFFLKQLKNDKGKLIKMPLLDNKRWDEMPKH
tara:strand:+ start:4698 stop:5411 length:714 start_codon:yes stop_codon:yes gene_type:complete